MCRVCTPHTHTQVTRRGGVHSTTHSQPPTSTWHNETRAGSRSAREGRPHTRQLHRHTHRTHTHTTQRRHAHGSGAPRHTDLIRSERIAASARARARARARAPPRPERARQTTIVRPPLLRRYMLALDQSPRCNHRDASPRCITEVQSPRCNTPLLCFSSIRARESRSARPRAYYVFPRPSLS